MRRQEAKADVERRAGAVGHGRGTLGGISCQSARSTNKGMRGHVVIPVNQVGGSRLSLASGDQFDAVLRQEATADVE